MEDRFARRSAPAAVSASALAQRRPGAPATHPRRSARPAAPTHGSPRPGTYAGWTEEAFPRPVRLRYLGRGVRDLYVDERLVARWIPVQEGAAAASEGGAKVRLGWTTADEVSGLIIRRRGAPRSVRFVAEHQAGAGLSRY